MMQGEKKNASKQNNKTETNTGIRWKTIFRKCSAATSKGTRIFRDVSDMKKKN